MPRHAKTTFYLTKSFSAPSGRGNKAMGRGAEIHRRARDRLRRKEKEREREKARKTDRLSCEQKKTFRIKDNPNDQF